MRHTYIITYDISDPKRLRKVFRLMLGYGDHLQLSVFQCDLNSRELVELKHALGEVINHAEDQVLFANLGSVEGRGSESIESLGRLYADPERMAVVA